MQDSYDRDPTAPGAGRRRFIGQAAALGTVGLGAGMAGSAVAQAAPDLAPYRSARIDWRCGFAVRQYNIRRRSL